MLRVRGLTMRPVLNQIPLSAAWPPRPGIVTATMSAGQWDGLLAAIYDGGGVLLELDDDEHPVRAFRRPHAAGTKHREYLAV
jgi:hypothetical protein